MARKKADGFKLVVRDKKSGDFSPRKRGRPSPDVEVGYLDAGGKFKHGNPRKRRGRRRKAAAVSVPLNGRVRRGRAPAPRPGLSEIDRIVRREVESRLRRAKDAALKALDRALDV